MRRGLLLGLPVLLVLGLGAGFLWFLGRTAAPAEAPERVTDGIAVLTGGAERVETGLRLLAAGRARLLLVTGTHRDARFAEIADAAGMAPEPLAARVTLGRAAASTRGNAAEIAAWVRANGIVTLRIVTAGYHMPRAMLEVRRALPAEVRLFAQPVVPQNPRGTEARRWSLLATEYAKWILVGLGLSELMPARDAARAR